MLNEKSCGALVYRKYHGNTEILLIKHLNSGHWSFPKGHVEEGETEVETAIREIKEETGIDVMIDQSFIFGTDTAHVKSLKASNM